MTKKKTDNHNSNLRSTNCVVAMHKTTLLLLGLWGLMMLQYEHEGHVDKPVMDHYTMKLFVLEEQLQLYVAELALDNAS